MQGILYTIHAWVLSHRPTSSYGCVYDPISDRSRPDDNRGIGILEETGIAAAILAIRRVLHKTQGIICTLRTASPQFLWKIPLIIAFASLTLVRGPYEQVTSQRRRFP